MQNLKRRTSIVATSLSMATSSLSCSQIAGLDHLSLNGAAGSVAAPTESGCSSNAQCTELATQAMASSLAAASSSSSSSSKEVPATEAASTPVPAICQPSTRQCVTLVSEDCSLVTGNYLDDRAVVIGSLFQTQGSTATQNIPRQQSATLAIEEIGAVGGIPSIVAGSARPLVMVSCNSAADLLRAARHLVHNIQVPAIVGPNTSQDTLDVSLKVTIQAGVAVLTPTAVAASIADLDDNDLTWLMIPSDDQRAELMMKQINDLESTLKADRNKTALRLSIVYRNDALGLGTRTSLDRLQFNGKPLADPVNAGSAAGTRNVELAPYDYKQTDQSDLVARQVEFAPDIVVLAGTAESITKVLTPLEQKWTAANRPFYFIIDPSKGPELISAVTGNDDLRRRVRGTGTAPARESLAVASAFELDYVARYGTTPTASGAGTSYDATYAVAYALAATKDQVPSGAAVAKGLRMLSGGSDVLATGTPDLLAAFQKLSAGKAIDAIGTASPLSWDSNGAVNGGTIEMWCIGRSGEIPVFQSSGLTYDIRTHSYNGEYVQCGP